MRDDGVRRARRPERESSWNGVLGAPDGLPGVMEAFFAFLSHAPTVSASTSTEDRMSAFVQVAALDHAWGRYDEAIKKYGTAYRYYLGTKNVAMQGVCLLFAGYSLDQQRRTEEARVRYRQTLDVAIPIQNKQLMLNALLALAASHQAAQDWSDAAQYWETACFVAKDMNNPFSLVDSAKNAGVCRLALNETPRALELWEQGKIVAQQAGYWEGAVAVLSYLVEVEGRIGMREAREQHQRELAAAQAQTGRQHQETAAARAETGLGGQPS